MDFTSTNPLSSFYALRMKQKCLIFSLFAFFPLTLFTAHKSSAQPNKLSSPLLAPWTGPYGGVPPFDQVKVSDFKQAIEEGIALEREEIKKIVENKEAPTFKNTLLALEIAGEPLTRVQVIFNIWSGSVQSEAFQKVEQEVTPLLAAFKDEIIQNQELFKRIEAIDASPEKAKLKPEEKRLLEVKLIEFRLNGSSLSDQQKKQVTLINQKLAKLYTQFSQNELADEENDYLLIEKAEDLAGLPASEIESAALEAGKRNLKGKWVISNTRSAMEPFLTNSSIRSLREKAFRIWSVRGDQNNANNNIKIVSEILNLRLERSKILGFETYAHWRLANSMAKKPEAAMNLLLQVWKPAVARVKQEVSDMQAIVDSEKGNFKIDPWDYRYYAEKVRKAKYDLDLNAIKPYLQLENVKNALFWSAQKLYGYQFKKIENLPVFNKKMQVYEVLSDRNQHIGLWYFDPFARKGKRSGAWMDSWRDQSRAGGKIITTIVSNNANFTEGKEGEPVLISWDDANTLFHEFGHALHGLSSNVTYPSLSGTNTARDFVEFPSQFNEHYLETREVLAFLKDKNGNPIPKELIDKIKNAKTFNQGFATVEFLASGIVDMKLHLSQKTNIDPSAFEKEMLKELGMPDEIIMRHRIPHFGHVFSGEEYAAGYYGYLWAQVLDNDAFQAFTERNNPFDRMLAKKFYKNILSVGNTIEPDQAYRNFRGRDAKVDALLLERGFPVK